MTLNLSPQQTDAKLRRKRQWASDGSIPPRWRQHFTEAQRAAMAVIVRQIRDHGHMKWCNAQIAAVAGVSRRTVQYALAKAVELGLLSRQLRRLTWTNNAPSVLKAKCVDLIKWLKKRRKRPIVRKPVRSEKTLVRKKTNFEPRYVPQSRLLAPD